MHQQRWTCLTTLILTAAIAPMATVRAAVTVPTVTTGTDANPLSPRSLLPIVPLTVTELQVEAVIPTVSQPVPLVSKLPIVAPLRRTPRQFSSQPQLARATTTPLTKNLQPQLPTSIYPHRISAPSTTAFNPNFQTNVPIVVTSDPTAAPVTAVAPLPSLTHSPAVAVASKTESTPILVVHRDRALTTIVPNSTTAQAEIDALPVPDARAATEIASSTAELNAPKTPQPEVTAVPQVAPTIAGTNNRSDIPSFEAGLPVFIFERERPGHRQIVATAIAQVGDDIVAPEPSIAIPVQSPKQQNLPTRIPVPTVDQPAPTPSIIDRPIIDRPTTSQPAPTKIVATYTGQASWYGSEGGSRTANGESYNPQGMTAAHRTLPFGTKVRVTSLRTGKAVVVRINDRGPFHGRRIVDISAGAAQAIGLKNDGVGTVRMEVLALGQ